MLRRRPAAATPPPTRPEPTTAARRGSSRARPAATATAMLALAMAVLLAPSAALAQPPGTPTAAGPQQNVSAHFMAEAIARNGAFASEECPPSTVVEHSTPGCARIPAPLDTAKRWLDLIEEAVFTETTRVGGWSAERNLAFAVWRLEPTGQRYLLVLAPHPHTEVTILYVSELGSAD